uniref:Magnetosome protein Mad1 n=1 Tax=Candidatus Magnetananas rongchengensis TaxID=1463558 RepID=A0A3S6IZR3_9BACT|nr:magnetosome protein Mad1 [Candidatus Magnetananas rongchenensis]
MKKDMFKKLVLCLFFIALFIGIHELDPLNAAKNVYYEPTIKNIILSDCARCHSGPTRNLMDYDSLKMYADSGLLSSMVQGPMSRFAGNDAQTIIDWADNGAPEKPPGGAANKVGFFSFSPHAGGCPGGRPGGGGGRAPWANIPANKITYNNTIKYVVAKDCLQCHSSQFRNLTTYKNVKMYVDNGLLEMLVDRGGAMHRFAGPDYTLFLSWIKNGAPQ